MSLKAIALVSGGLDSALAAKIIKLQGVEVIGIAFITPFTCPETKSLAQSIGIQIYPHEVSLEYLDLLRNPRFGFGKNLNPCIDCHIFMLKKARELMSEYKADFIVSGEVLGQRPMSQNSASLKKIEKESGLDGLLIRPLSARLLPETMVERNGWVKRNLLYGFSGRSRKPQMELVKKIGLQGFGQPAGGCLLTDAGFSQRLKDLLNYQRELNLDDIQLLKLGRHFRLNRTAKLIVGRNQQENQRLINFANTGKIILRSKEVPGPTAILDTKDAGKELLDLSAGIVARYCDRKNGSVCISVDDGRNSWVINSTALEPDNLEALRV